jgi:hypothetical protein
MRKKQRAKTEAARQAKQHTHPTHAQPPRKPHGHAAPGSAPPKTHGHVAARYSFVPHLGDRKQPL